ncbi:hypothetical protein TSUD_197660 [Trifolium subterraneum]|uniref:Uncharacterized protein n=1 Tax=Trifolium subterraneum TaxID=3900 RepID=A0A2Z6LJQ3_TRISU|nr:hypothetical protein TSUD_197660 [Trifolium subterraneum]
MKLNVKFLLDFGVTSSSIYRLLITRPSIICSTDLKKVLEEIKELGFGPSSYKFVTALLAKRVIAKSQWDAKIDALKSWGCSEDQIFNAFKKQPNIMLRSADKLNVVMHFWIKQLGWDPLLLLSAPDLFGFSIEKRLIPRASVVQYILSKGLMKKDASLITPFCLTDELFLQRFSFCYPLSGDAVLRKSFSVEYKFEEKGSGDFLMLAYPLHLQLFSKKVLMLLF